MEQNRDTHLVVMAGGIGSRFWPLSTPQCPKQFVDVLGCGKSLLQQTIARFDGIVPPQNIWILTSHRYSDILAQQLPNIPKENLLYEPDMRNTAPCIAYVGWKIKSITDNNDANIVVVPSDQLITDTAYFQDIIKASLKFISTNSSILTIGISPRSPHTGFGYIAASGDAGDIKKVISFKEKPTLEVAQQYLAEGNYYWNSGMFLWSLSTLISAFRENAPEIASLFDKISESFNTPNEAATIQELYPTAPKISVDYAIMEKADNIYVYPGDPGWSDLGTWGSLKEHIAHDSDGNYYTGNVEITNCKNCIIYGDNNELLTVENKTDRLILKRNGAVEEYLIIDGEKIVEAL